MRKFLILSCLMILCAGAGAQDVTEAVHIQRALIDAQVARFADESPPGGRVYFLGFAGVGEERVFAEEIKLAARRVGERFGSSQRSLLLLNDRRDLTTWPLASASSLRYSLAEIARVMNLDEDVLFLALSSHGSRNSGIVVSNTNMFEDGLSPRTVARLLEESGIRWRVVVVSACFSGSFIKPLADNHTVVITAAAKNRSSFGCSDQRDLTYFGEAFYRDALARTSDLREAFADARQTIRLREQEEDFTPSQPQAYFGLLIEDKLRTIEQANAPIPH
jgi:hypothetical protein